MQRLLTLLILLAVAPALAQVYRWVDEKGRVHYGEQPPQGVKKTEVQGTSPGSAAPAPAPERRDTSRGPLYAPKGDPAAEAREKKAAEDKRLREAKASEGRKPACAAAKEALTYAERNRLVHEKKGVLSKKVPYSDDEQRDEIHARRRTVNQNCF